MDIADFTSPSGQLVPTIAKQRAFVPAPLPPLLDLNNLQQLLSDADQKLGELRGIGRYLPNPFLLIRPLQRKEAIASSNIEGTYTSLSELLLFESGIEDHVRSTDTREVYNYIETLRVGFQELEKIPISTRLLNLLHHRLLMGLPRSRSGDFAPGQYRSEQNLIGKSKDILKSRFNPPPPPYHHDCMSDLEKFINQDLPANLPPLIFLAIIHYQFETIHPYPDGNGRVGRILLPLALKKLGIMDEPLLYMSQYFEDNRDEYVDLLLCVSQRSEWNEWIGFFLRGVSVSCEKTINTIQKMRQLQENYQNMCHQARSSALLLKIVDTLFDRIAITVPQVKDLTSTSYTAALNNVNKLVSYGILSEYGFSMRPKFYFAKEIMDIFES